MANVRDTLETDAPRPLKVGAATGPPQAGSPQATPRRARRSAIMAFLAVVGPGVIAAAAGNDAGGIATFSTVGASYGYRLLWMFALITVSLALVQEMCARMGAATGKGLADLIRENFGIRRTAFVMLALLVANGATTVSEFVGAGAALELFGIPRLLGVPVVAFGVWWLVIKGSYKRVEVVFLGLAAIFLAYPVAAFMAEPDWREVGRSLITPSLQWDVGYLSTFIATVGTTITPYMQIYVQSAVAEKGVTMRDYPLERLDVFVGAVFGSLISFFIIVATAAQLNPRGIQIETAADAAEALAPLVGPGAKYLFAAGLFGACVLAAAVLPLSTAYSLSEAFGFERGVSRSFREAPVFHSIFSGLIAIGAAVAILPDLPIIDLLLQIQVINGLLLPVVLISILTLVNDRSIMGRYTNGPLYNVIAWGTVVLVVVLSAAMIGLTLLQRFGLVAG